MKGSNLAKDPRGWYARGYLPHFDGGEIPQSITIRLAGSLPQPILEAWRIELRHLPAEAVEVERRRRIEDYLDRGLNVTWLANPPVAELVENALLYLDGLRYELHGWVVMPNHVHASLTPRGRFPLASILHSWKSYTAHRANRILRRRGTFWEREYFDRYLRDQRHFDAVLAYIDMNPVKAGLCARAEDWPYSSARWRKNPRQAATSPAPGGAR